MSSSNQHQNSNDLEVEPVAPPRRRGKSKKILAKGKLPLLPKDEIKSSQSPPKPSPPSKPDSPPRIVTNQETKGPSFCKKEFVLNLEQKLANVDICGNIPPPGLNGSKNFSDGIPGESKAVQPPAPAPKPKPRPRPSPATSARKPLPRPRASPRKGATIGPSSNRRLNECPQNIFNSVNENPEVKNEDANQNTNCSSNADKIVNQKQLHDDKSQRDRSISNPNNGERHESSGRLLQLNNDVFVDPSSSQRIEQIDIRMEEVSKDDHDYEIIPTSKRQPFRLEKLRSCSYENVPPPVKHHSPVRLSQSLPQEAFPIRFKDSYKSAVSTLRQTGGGYFSNILANQSSNTRGAEFVQSPDSDEDDQFEVYVNMSDSSKKSPSAVDIKSEKGEKPLFGIRKRSLSEIEPENDLSKLDNNTSIPYNVLLGRRRNLSLDEYVSMDSSAADHYQVPSSPTPTKARSHTVHCPEHESHFVKDKETGKNVRRPPPSPPVLGMRNTMKIRNMPDEAKDEFKPSGDVSIPEVEPLDNSNDLYSVPRDKSQVTNDNSAVTDNLIQDSLYSVPRPLSDDLSNHSNDSNHEDRASVQGDEDPHGEYIDLSAPGGRFIPSKEQQESYVDMQRQRDDVEDGHYSVAIPTSPDILPTEPTEAVLVPQPSQAGSQTQSIEGYSTPRKEVPRRPPPPKVPTSVTNNIGGNDVYSKIDSLKREMRETVHSKNTCSGAAYFSDSETESEGEAEETTKDDDGKGKLYYIATEILTTERAFVDALKLLCEDFGGGVKRLLAKDPKALPDGAFNQIFLNIEQIYNLDLKFLQELEVRMKNWDEHKRIGDIIREYGHFLKIYTTYIRGYDHALAAVQDNIQKMPKFASLVKEYERSPKFKSLKLTSFLLKPIQRIPSYRLLLLDYLKNLEDGSPDMKDITDGVKIVSDVAEYINESMKEGEKFQDVLRVQSQIINSNEIVRPGRYLIKEGLLRKLSRKDTQERMFYLFTDSLLYCSSMGHNQYKLILEMPLSTISVHMPKSEDFQNEFSVISTKRSFMLAALTAEDRNDWMKALNGAIEEVTKKLVTFGLKKGAEDPFSLLPSEKELGSVAPPWVPDDRVTMCMSCTKGFTVYNRRHHCRACGKVVCNSCSSYEAPLQYMDNEAVRVCEKCFSHLYHVQIYEETNGNEIDGVPPSPVTNGSSLDRDELRSRFRVIKAKKRNRRTRKSLPSKLTEVMADEDSSIDSGHLKMKKGKTWKKYWFVLKDHVLYTYKAPSDPAALDTMPVLGFDLEKSPDVENDELVFKLSHKGLKEPVLFKAENKHLKDRWTQCLAQAITFPPT